jgi:hypothetical protein
MSYATSVTVEFLDGTDEVHTWVTRQHIGEGCLHLFSQTGQMAPEKHLGSYPLVSIKKWTRSER